MLNERLSSRLPPIRRAPGQRNSGAPLSAGFTLIELLITLAILGALATLVIPMAEIQVQRIRENELRSALSEIRSAIDAYKRAAEEGRIRVPIGGSGYPPNLEILVKGVEDLRDLDHHKIFFLRRVPRDPFHESTATTESDTWGKRSYRSSADDPREGSDVYDIYSRSNQVALNGIAYSKW